LILGQRLAAYISPGMMGLGVGVDVGGVVRCGVSFQQQQQSLSSNSFG
jgi:multisubunit Na+/H+ antiporter MnhB subunit